MFLHGILDTKGVTKMGHAATCRDLPCEWAQFFLYTCAERGIQDSALILIATWHRQGPAMTQQFNVNHGQPDGDLMTIILAYKWCLEGVKNYSSSQLDTGVEGMYQGGLDSPCTNGHLRIGVGAEACV